MWIIEIKNCISSSCVFAMVTDWFKNEEKRLRISRKLMVCEIKIASWAHAVGIATKKRDLIMSFRHKKSYLSPLLANYRFDHLKKEGMAEL